MPCPAMGTKCTTVLQVVRQYYRSPSNDPNFCALTGRACAMLIFGDENEGTYQQQMHVYACVCDGICYDNDLVKEQFNSVTFL